MDPLSQVFCLKWNNHQNNLLTVLDHLYQTEAFCDVTLACDNTSIKCHKMILSACSSYFQTLFMENTCEHPIVFLKDIKIGEVRAILDYMYKGEVNVAQEELPGTILFTLFCLYVVSSFQKGEPNLRNVWVILLSFLVLGETFEMFFYSDHRLIFTKIWFRNLYWNYFWLISNVWLAQKRLKK